MISHIVLYRAYGRNPQASQKILDEAVRTLRPLIHEIGGQFHASRALPLARSVTPFPFDVGMYCSFPDLSSFHRYMRHEIHQDWCRFVLRGWQIPGSEATDPNLEFIEQVLGTGGGDILATRERDATSDDDVVWDGESVFDFGETGDSGVKANGIPV